MEEVTGFSQEMRHNVRAGAEEVDVVDDPRQLVAKADLTSGKRDKGVEGGGV